MTEQKKGWSPWAWVGMGCGCLILLLIAAMVTCGIAGRKFVQEIEQLEESMRDPVKRAEKVAENLHYDTLPEGYVPAFAISIPFVGDIAILADRPLDQDGNDDFERMFFVYRVGSLIQLDSDWRDVISGRKELDDLLKQVDMNVRGRERLGDGTLSLDGTEVQYSAQRGDLSHGGGRGEGVFAILLARCSDDPVVAIWLEPDENPDTPYDEVDWTGTPADPQAIESFVGHFQLCE